MQDAAVQAAHERRAKIERDMVELRNSIRDANARLSNLQEQAAEIETFINMWHRLTNTPYTPQAAERSEIGLPVVKRKRPKNPDREVVVEKAVEVIREHGVPLSRRELFDVLTGMGVIIRGKDPEMVLSTMLWRSKDKIVRLPNHGYWPADVSYDPALYDPEIEDFMEAAAKEPEDGVEVDEDEDDEEEDGSLPDML